MDSTVNPATGLENSCAAQHSLTIGEQEWQMVGVVLSRTDLELDPGVMIAIEQQYLIGEHVMPQIRRGAVEWHQVDVALQQIPKLLLHECQAIQILELRPFATAERHGEVDIAVAAVLASRNAAEQVGSHDALTVGQEPAAQGWHEPFPEPSSQSTHTTPRRVSSNLAKQRASTTRERLHRPLARGLALRSDARMTTHHVLVLTGAGISADSGVRTFRDANGLWEGHAVEAVATPEGWQADPRLVWRFYQERRAQLRTVQPNAAHHALAAFAADLAESAHTFTLVTQNVDDLHDRAGSEVLHMHGELLRLRCERCELVVHDTLHVDPGRFVPCPECEHPRLRPHIVWFGEVPFHLAEIERALRRCTHFVAIGTSGVVYPAAGMLQQARAAGAVTWVQSLEPPDNLSAGDRYHQGRAAEVVPVLLRELAAALGLAAPE